MAVQQTVSGSVTFLLGKLCGIATALFAKRLAATGLKPRHCAVLELASSMELSQLELANRIGVTASVVVDMLDELEDLGAVRRVAQAGDRRRRVVKLTETGRELREQAARAAHEVDAELLRDLDARSQTMLRSALAQVGSTYGLSYR